MWPVASMVNSRTGPSTGTSWWMTEVGMIA
jgi:hypothetical protein